MDFTLPFKVNGYAKYMTSDACYSIAHKHEIPVYTYTVPYDQVEEFIATVNGGERTPGPGARKAPGHSKLNRRVTG